MFKKSFRMGALALGATLISSAASAVTVDTFDFTLSTGWMRPVPHEAPVVDPGAALVGSFVGVVESDPLGTIALGDLSAFSASFTDSEGFAIGGSSLQSGLSTLTSFRYETLGGAGTLSFGQALATDKGSACVGFFAFLSDATCEFRAQEFLGANALIQGAAEPYGFTADLPTITLVSSVTTPPAVPEPGTWVLFGLGGLSLAFIGRRKDRTEWRSRRRREAMAYLA